MVKATKRELELVLAIFIFSTFIPYLKFLTGLAFGVCDWNEFHSFYYLSGFIGYLFISVPFSIPNIEMVWYYCSPNVLLEAVGVFLLVEGMEFKEGVFLKAINAIAHYSFGIFLVHYFFIGFIFRSIAVHFELHPVLNVLVSCLFTLIIAFGVVCCLAKFRLTRKLVM